MPDTSRDDKDQLADALAAMGGTLGSSSFVDDEGHGSVDALDVNVEPIAPAPAIVTPDPLTPDASSASPPSPARSQRPVRPGVPAARPGRSLPSLAPPPTLGSSAPASRAPAPTLRSSTPVPSESSVAPARPAPLTPISTKLVEARPARPLAPSLAAPPPPTAPVPAPFLPGVADPISIDAGDSFVTDEEDDFVLPAILPQTTQQRTSPRVKPAWHPTMTFRRTIIPICLTFGIIAIGLGVAWLMVDTASIFRRTGIVMPVTLFVAGPLMLVLGVLNMLAVRAQLRRQASP